MQLKNATAEIFIPPGAEINQALARTTHMGIGAHQDDLEIMAFHGILECFQQPDKWFTGVTVTDGSGSPRDDVYKEYTDDEMRAVRRKEQKKAAVVGEYAAQVLLDYASKAVKDPANPDLREDLKEIIALTHPRVIYTHNLADKHDTHVAVTVRTIEALRELDPTNHPTAIYGCEVWRDLDWTVDHDKVTMDVSGHPNLQAALMGIFDSQVCGGKRYDLATIGRRTAHATYFATHGVDTSTGLIFTMDLTPLIRDPTKNIGAYVSEYIARFQQEVVERLAKVQIQV